MPELSFTVEAAEPVAYAASPTLALKLRVASADDAEPVRNVMLQCQIRIETSRRRYTPTEQEGMLDLFGPPHRWGTTLHSMLWTRVVAMVPPFVGSTVVNVLVPCTFDFNVAATKYFHALEDGEVPITLLFSGTIFFHDAGGSLQVMQVPWDKEATFRLPVRVWKEMMELYYPNSAWLCLRRDAFDQLHRYKSMNGIPSWEQALERLIDAAPATEGVAP
jgi:hypothetical protein